MLKSKLFLASCLFYGINIVDTAAQTCATPPSCASMGYTLSAPTGDKGYACSACPFDATKWACTATTCPSGYQTGLKGAEYSGHGIAVTGSITYYIAIYKYRCHWGFSGGKSCRMPSYGTYKFRLTSEDIDDMGGWGSDAMNDFVYSRMCGAQ